MASNVEMGKDSWREKRIEQDVKYTDEAHLKRVLGQLESLPGLVTPVEIDRLREQMAQVADGNAFCSVATVQSCFRIAIPNRSKPS